jgi:hypothetical protein
MTIDPSGRSSRRAILGAALGGAAAVAVNAIAIPRTVVAADGDNALLGTANTSTTETSFENTDAGETSVVGVHAGAGTGVRGTSLDGVGAVGQSTDSTPSDGAIDSHRTGVWGTAGDEATIASNTDESGVYGFCDVSDQSTGVWGDSPQGVGVYGTGDVGMMASGGSSGLFAFGPTQGIFGNSSLTGRGITGVVGGLTPVPFPTGVAVYARADENTSITALQVLGKVKFSRSGRKSITAKATSAKVTLAGVTTSSYVVATLQTSVTGCYVRAAVPSSGSFTIYLSKAPGKTVYVGYFVIN